MAGHSKYSNIKHKKSLTDQKKAKVFTHMSRDIATAIKIGGGTDVDQNLYLKHMIKRANHLNVPLDVIHKAIESHNEHKDSGEHKIYEGYGKNGVAFLIETHTDNSNKTSAEIKHFFKKIGGHMDVCLFLFKEITKLTIKGQSLEDIYKILDKNFFFHHDINEDAIVLYGDREHSKKLMIHLENIDCHFEISYIPHNMMEINNESREEVLNNIHILFDSESVNRIYTNIEGMTVIDSNDSNE